MEGGSFECVVAAFANQVAELREATLLRVDASTRELYAQDLGAIEATVRALEHQLRDIKAFVHREKAAVPHAEAVVEACRLQRRHLQHIAAHLPGYLPSLRSPEQGTGASAAAPALRDVSGRGELNQGAAAAEPAAAAKKRPPAPRKYVGQDELNTVSSYMRSRLTIDKINAALDELAGLAEANAALVAAARRNKGMGPDKKHAMFLAYHIAPHEGLKGRHWVLEADLRSGSAVRLDKTGKTALTLLRHLGRLQEARVSAEGTTHLVYALVP